MSNHFLHLDISRGCTVHSLVAALEKLKDNINVNKRDKKIIEVTANFLYNKISNLLLKNEYVFCDDELNKLNKFCVLINELNPAAISSTLIPLSFSHKFQTTTNILFVQ